MAARLVDRGAPAAHEQHVGAGGDAEPAGAHRVPGRTVEQGRVLQPLRVFEDMLLVFGAELGEILRGVLVGAGVNGNGVQHPAVTTEQK